MSLLTIEGLSKSFGGLKALKDISIEIPEDEFLGIIGPNGAGKTTLFSVLAGQIPPTSGQVTFDGRDITGWAADRVASIGLVRTFQLMRPFESMTVLENVAIASHSKHRSVVNARTHAAAVIERVGLGPYINSMSGTLPTAGLKRLELARALALEPKMILLDEVLAGLVPTERAPIIELLRDIHREGVTVMFVEHIMAAVMALSQRLLVMHEGQQLALGDPASVIQDTRVVDAYLGEDYA
ncbi:ABC transporter ATP-binding protein [Cryobacterium sp. CG_9.6]|uniref:ABC transporter ATP-binding protein n=1 Tax=Cryobacterium sp. CG_9.6 TaxID=2760710 RepID=UPI002472FAAD|nr:ABC transporter ATP-binding protein [Cryobacterium sp. CG_9.6]MDH6238111.1 branched-chain amino acid transport system ATP-binding protein [Cryobacterium sp. CG_9.6]